APYASASLNQITTGPDGNLWFTDGGTSSIGRAVLGLATTTLTLSSSPGPATFGRTVISVTGTPSSGAGRPTGNVVFATDGLAQAPVPLSVVVGQEIATFPALTLPPGAHTITATYVGDTNFAGSSTVSPLFLTVNPATPVMTVTRPGGTYTGLPFAAQ